MKLFNRERFQLLRGTRLQKYLGYAIGEVILVIIGILFALGINNWNQNRQITNANIELQKKVLIQLDKDIQSIKYFKRDLDSLEQVYLKVLKRDYDKSKVNEGSVISTVLFKAYALSLDKNIINLIDNAILDDSPVSQDLIDISSDYKTYMKNISDIEKIIFEKLTSNLAEIETTQGWYTELITDFHCGNDCVKYLLFDESHKARVASLRFLYTEIYGDKVNGFQNDLQRAKSSLEEKINLGE